MNKYTFSSSPANRENLREQNVCRGDTRPTGTEAVNAKREITVVRDHFNRKETKCSIKPYRALSELPIRKTETAQQCLMAHIWLGNFFFLSDSPSSVVNHRRDPHFFICSLTEPSCTAWVGQQMPARGKAWNSTHRNTAGSKAAPLQHAARSRAVSAMRRSQDWYTEGSNDCKLPSAACFFGARMQRSKAHLRKDAGASCRGGDGREESTLTNKLGAALLNSCVGK